jgi:predicted nucleic acid-binding Zn ribbon protein
MPGTQPCPRCSAPVPERAKFCQKCGSHIGSGPSQKQAGHAHWNTFFIGALALVLVIGASLAGIQLSRHSQTAAAPVAATNEIHGMPMPGWLATADPGIVAQYIYAADHEADLQYIPCYCGCGAQGHTSNYECYFRKDQNGALAFESHAYG